MIPKIFRALGCVTRHRLAHLALAFVFAACGSDTTAPETPTGESGLQVQVASVQVVGLPEITVVGKTMLLSAVVRAPDGSVLFDRTLSWTSSDPSVGTIASVGTQTASLVMLAPGSLTITLTVEGKSATALTTVRAPALSEEAFLWTEEGGMVSLGALPDARGTHANAINGVGQVVGHSGNRAFLWSLDHGMTELRGLPGAAGSDAAAINQQGDVVGSSWFAGGHNHAVLWMAGGAVVDITPPGNDSWATGINDRGEIVGVIWSTRTQVEQGFRWSAADGLTFLSTGANQTGEAKGINGDGVVAGFNADTDWDFPVTALWTPTGTLRTPMQCEGCVSMATAINSSGQVVGWYGYYDLDFGSRFIQRAFLMQPDGSLVGLDAGARNAPTAISVNDAGTIVGTASTSQSGEQAFIWTAARGMRDLGRLPGYSQSSASGINNLGQVVGSSW